MQNSLKLKSPPYTPRSPSARAALAASQDKLGSIVEFLDKAEASVDEKHTINESEGHEAEGVKMKMVALEMEVAEQSKVLELLKRTLKEERKKKQEIIVKAREHEKERLEKLGKEYESAVKKQMAFTNKLLKDKEELNTKCSELAQEIQSTEEKLLKRIHDQKEEFIAESKRKKEGWQQAERIRRENLVQQMTDDIKARTIKGLEPEIQKMLNEHRQEVQRLKVEHENELAAVKSMIADQHEQDLVDVQNQLLRGQAEAIETQVQVMRHKMIEERKEMMERFNEEKKETEERHQQDLKGRDERLATEHRSFMDEVERTQYEWQARLNSLREEHEKEMERQQEEFRRRIDHQKTDLQSLQDAWKRETRESMEKEFVKKKAEYEKEIQKQRDEEIDMIIQKLDTDSVAERQRQEEKYKGQLENLRRRHDREIENIKHARNEWADKAKEGLDRSREYEEKLRQARIENKEKEEIIRDLQEETKSLRDALEELNDSLDTIKEDLGKEHVEEMDEKQREIDELKSTVSGLELDIERRENLHTDEIEQLSLQNQNELKNLNERVRDIIGKKEGLIGDLKEKLRVSEARIGQVEALLDKQREEFLKM